MIIFSKNIFFVNCNCNFYFYSTIVSMCNEKFVQFFKQYFVSIWILAKNNNLGDIFICSNIWILKHKKSFKLETIFLLSHCQFFFLVIIFILKILYPCTMKYLYRFFVWYCVTTIQSRLHFYVMKYLNLKPKKKLQTQWVLLIFKFIWNILKLIKLCKF